MAEVMPGFRDIFYEYYWKFHEYGWSSACNHAGTFFMYIKEIFLNMAVLVHTIRDIFYVYKGNFLEYGFFSAYNQGHFFVFI